MPNNHYLFTSESVSEGHPDKIADQISDAVLDETLKGDPHARVACESFIKNGMVLIGGEISTSTWVDVESLAREVIKEIGYDNPEYGFDWETCAVLSCIGRQSPDIAQGVDRDGVESAGAGDQGIMFGYACRSTKEYMPAPIAFAHRLVKQQSQCRKQNTLPWLRPDAKSQVTVVFDEAGSPVAIDSIVLSTQHDPDIEHSQLEEAVIEEIIKPVLPAKLITQDTKYFINPTGRFVIGGPVADCGLTGRKIIVDTYGGMARHGGGCFSGKDPSKVDRTAAYMCRYIAKNIVAAGLADRIEIQVSYAIGVTEPISIHVNTFGTSPHSGQELTHLIKNHFNLTPAGMIAMLDLLKPIYRQTASYGHFGRVDHDFAWESLDKVDELKQAMS